MRSFKINYWSFRDNAGWIYLGMTLVVMPFNMVHVHGLGDARLLIKVPQVTIQVGVIDDSAQVAFEMDVINRIKAHQGAKEPPIGFHNAAAEQVTLPR